MNVGPGNQISSILDNVCGHNTLGKGKKVNGDTRFLHILPFFTQARVLVVQQASQVPEINICKRFDKLWQKWKEKHHACKTRDKHISEIRLSNDAVTIYMVECWRKMVSTSVFQRGTTLYLRFVTKCGMIWVKNGKMCKNLVSRLTFFPFPRVLWPHTLSKMDEIWFSGPNFIKEQLCFYEF